MALVSMTGRETKMRTSYLTENGMLRAPVRYQSRRAMP